MNAVSNRRDEPSNGLKVITEPLNETELRPAITPGEIQKLVVPREDIGAGLVVSEELDVASLAKKKIRKPGRREWVRLHRSSEMTTRLLAHKPRPDSMDEEYYFVRHELRKPIQDELKNYRVFVFYGVSSKSFGLWMIPVTDGGSWYESLLPLLSQPSSFFDENEILVKSDKAASVYRVRFRPVTCEVEWLKQPTENLLGEALGDRGFIISADNPLYASLIGGQEL
jgi:hypothetical protein